MNNKKILIVEEEEALRKKLSANLSKQGFVVLIASGGQEALKLFNSENPDLIVLGVLLSHITGYDVCRNIRETSKTPIIFLTSLGSISDRIKGLNLGADDYLIKPFYFEELVARINAVLRRTKQKPKQQFKENIFTFSGIFFDAQKQQLRKNGSLVKLTKIESSLLTLLITNAGLNLSRAYILKTLWGYTPERYIDQRVVDVHIARLRSKLEEDPSNPDFILTIRGMGYIFQK
jgi:OmpR family response regulator RpaB